MASLDYVAASTFFRQKGRGGAATRILHQDKSKRSQLDYIFCKRQHLGLIQKIKNDWAPTAWKSGTYADHCMQVVVVQRTKLRPQRRTDTSRSWAQWMRDPEVVAQMTHAARARTAFPLQPRVSVGESFSWEVNVNTFS